jgi:1-acyl-sn-glycerol-3-phosphate acyltransferase
VVATTKVLFSLVGDRHTQGAENLPASGPVIVAANHLTNFDVFPLQHALPRTIFYMGKAELYRNPALDWLLRQLGSFPVQRGARDAWAIDHAEKVLRSGQVLGIFPEGSRSKGRGLRPAKTGVARLAQAVDCPILPVAIHGTQYMFRHFPRRTPVQINIGAPLYPEPSETLLALTDRVMFTLAGMLPPEARGVYSYRPPGF